MAKLSECRFFRFENFDEYFCAVTLKFAEILKTQRTPLANLVLNQNQSSVWNFWPLKKKMWGVLGRVTCTQFLYTVEIGRKFQIAPINSKSAKIPKTQKTPLTNIVLSDYQSLEWGFGPKWKKIQGVLCCNKILIISPYGFD